MADDVRRDGNYEIVDLRVLPRSRRRATQRWPAWVDGYGCLRQGNSYESFFVAWDRQRAPDVHRSARVHAWYDAVEAWGSGRLPRILLVTPSRDEEPRWKSAVSITARRRGDYDLDIGVTTAADALGGQPTGPVWRWLGEDDGQPLAQIIAATDGLPLFEAPRPVRYDLLERGVATHTPSLKAWAAGTVHSVRTSGREQTAGLRLTLDPVRLRVIEELARHPYLTEQELAYSLGESLEVARRLLRDIERGGAIAAIEQETARSVVKRYFVTYAGLRLLAAREGVPALRYAANSVVAAETSARGRGGSRLRNLRGNLDHTIGPNVFFARLARDAQRAGHPRPYWWSEAEATKRFRHNDRDYWVRPDGAGLYSIGDQRMGFLFEYDRGTMRRRDYMRKLAGITAYFESAGYRGSFSNRPIVLVVAETDGGESRFAAVAREAAQQFGIDLPMFFTTLQHVERRSMNPAGTLGPIWRPYDSEVRGSWLDGMEAGQR